MKTQANFYSAPDVSFDFIQPQERVSVSDRIALALDRTIYGILLFCFVLFAIPYGTVEAWWESCFELVIFSLTALWIVEGALSGAWQVSGVRLFIPLLALAAFAFIQTVPLGAGQSAGITFQRTLSVDPYETQRFALKLLALGLAGMLLLRYAANRRRTSLLILTIISVGIASAIFGLIRQTAQHDAVGFALPFLRQGEGYGQFINRNHFAFLMEMTLGLATGLVITGGVRRDRMLIYLAAIAPLWAALVLSNSRGGIFSLLSQVFFLALLVGNTPKKKANISDDADEAEESWFSRLNQSRVARAALAFCLVLVLAVSIVWMGGDMLANRMETLPQEVDGEVKSANAPTGNGTSRVEVWTATLSLIKAHLIRGSGLGAYKTAIPAHHQASGEMVPEEAHNDYLELLASGGLIGCLLAAWLLLAFFKTARERLRAAEPVQRAVCYGALTGMFGAAVHSLVDFGLHITINALVFTALAAIATVQMPDPGQKPIKHQ